VSDTQSSVQAFLGDDLTLRVKSIGDARVACRSSSKFDNNGDFRARGHGGFSRFFRTRARPQRFVRRLQPIR
jgi:hypothetical protein